MLTKFKRTLTNIGALFNYPEIHAELSRKRNLYFFFPYWSFGGAERVHVDILNLFSDQRPLCFITERSKNEGFRKELEAAADVINLGRWSEKKAYKSHLLKKVSRAINTQQQPIVFGWCSRFMYDLIPMLEPHVRIIDLTHNFTENLTGIEWYSLPHIPRIEKRIVVGQTIAEQFKALYKLNHVSDNFLKKLIVVRNKIPFNNLFPKKNYDDILQILFVARNSVEKRVEIFIRITQLCQQLKLPVAFKMIGDFNSEKNRVAQNTQIVGVINDKAVLDKYYKEAHLLLLTSQSESWGLVIFEGMNFGVVPVTTDVGELDRYISAEKENGVLIKNLTQQEQLANMFVEEIKRFLFNRVRLKKFSINAFETVKKLSRESDFDAAYRNIISGKSE